MGFSTARAAQMMDAGRITECFDAHGASLVLYARQWLDRAAAEDVVQEVFVHLMLEHREPANLRAWLFTCVRNAVISLARSSHRRQQRERSVAEARPGWFESRIEDRIDAEAAQQAMQTLPAEQREVVVLRIWGGLSFAEVAQIVHCPLSTVYDHYRAALGALRQYMESRHGRSTTTTTTTTAAIPAECG